MHAPVRDAAHRAVGSSDAPNPRSVHRSSTSPPGRIPSTSTSVGGNLLRLESPPPGCRPRPAPRPALRAGRAPGPGGARPAACATTGLRCSAWRARGNLCISPRPLIERGPDANVLLGSSRTAATCTPRQRATTIDPTWQGSGASRLTSAPCNSGRVPRVPRLHDTIAA
jgi:hypothetical protein